jgi:hypothetical protein
MIVGVSRIAFVNQRTFEAPTLVSRINEAAAQEVFRAGVAHAVAELTKALHGGEDELLRTLHALDQSTRCGSV